MANLIMLPEHPLFEVILSSVKPPGWRQASERLGDETNYVADPETGLLRTATPDELMDYVWGGEYDERLEQLGEEVS
ncbi:MAG: hypothetical protein F6K42_34245 [Leptolyngbya sp. SIO1D8]|nr:hypothetical protein [Leptolyngbya sp. SIO1D8]